MNDSGTGNRTSPDYWDKYWADVRVPIEIVRTRSVLGSSQADCILAAFDACLPRDRSFSALEIGGAPGQYLAFLKRAFRCDVAALDFSPLGCQKTRENFALLDLPIRGLPVRPLFARAGDGPVRRGVLPRIHRAFRRPLRHGAGNT